MVPLASFTPAMLMFVVAPPDPAARALAVGRSVHARAEDSNTVFGVPEPQWQDTALGRYLVIGELGRGGIGSVYRTYDPRLQREVALEALQDDALSEREREGMWHEAQTMAQLSHPNVVRLYDVEMIGKRVLLAMEYVPGPTLRDWLADDSSSGRRSRRDILDAFRAAGRGLAAAHAASLVHRQFEPLNVVVGRDGIVRVRNFGLVRPDAANSATASLRYMAPELHEQLPAGAAADQYAFCAALWEALVGEPPFEGESEAALRTGKRGGPPQWPRGIGVPRRVPAALRRGLAAQPEQRWPDMTALLHELADDSQQQRRRAVASATAAVVLGCSALAWSAWSAEHQKRCSGAQTQLQSAWGPEQREAVKASLLGTELAYAQSVWNGVEPQLDAFATNWAAMHREACEATNVRGEQTVAAMDLRMACLHRARVDLQSVTDLFTRADEQVLERAHTIVSSLPSLERCADVEALADDVPPPEGSAAAEVEATRVALSEAVLLTKAGKHAEALAALLRLEQRADEIGYGPLRTEVLLALGIAHQDVGAHVTSESTLEQALRLGLRWKQWEVAQRAASLLVTLVGALQMRAAEGLGYAVTARALLEPENTKLAALLHRSIGHVYENQKRVGEAEAEYRAALKLWQESKDADALQSTIFRSDVANALMFSGRYAEAEREHQANIEVREQALGSDHPWVAMARINLAIALASQGDFAAARQSLTTALSTLVAAYGPYHVLVGDGRHNLAAMTYAQGDCAGAEIEAKAALDVRLRLFGPEHPGVAITRFNHAAALHCLGRYEEAEVEHREVLALRTKLLGAEHPLVADSRNHLGLAYDATGRHEEAEREHRAALELQRKALSPDHPDIAQARTYLAEALASQGRLAEAEAEQRAALAMREKVLGETSLEVAHSRMSLAYVLAQQGRIREATELYDAGLILEENAMAPGNPLVDRTRAAIDRLTASSRKVSPAKQPA